MRIGILCPGQMGDVTESTGLFKYREELWGPEPEIYWFVYDKFRQPLERNPHVEVHTLQAQGQEGLIEAEHRARQLHCEALYATAPWLNWEHVWKVPLPLIPVMALGLDLKGRPWRPQIYLTLDELKEVRHHILDIPGGVRVFLETACFSHQAEWTDEMTQELAERLPEAVFVCGSWGYADKMMEMGIPRVVGLDLVGYRQLTEVYNYCDLFVGVASGCASVTCAERCRVLPRVEYVEESRCPGWGTAAMVPSFASHDSKTVLDRAVSIVENLPRGKWRRKEKRHWGREPLGIV